jgi:hypothetical protein
MGKAVNPNALTELIRLRRSSRLLTRNNVLLLDAGIVNGNNAVSLLGSLHQVSAVAFRISGDVWFSGWEAGSKQGAGLTTVGKKVGHLTDRSLVAGVVRKSHVREEGVPVAVILIDVHRNHRGEMMVLALY